jgi:hypothetical protein
VGSFVIRAGSRARWSVMDSFDAACPTSAQLPGHCVREIVRRKCVAGSLDTRTTVTLSTNLDAEHDDGTAEPDAFAQMLDWGAEQ